MPDRSGQLFTASSAGRPLKYTLCITLRCNLACRYCYVTKTGSTMSLATARRVVDFIFRNAGSERGIEIGFFGGEPLLEFGLLKEITDLIENHPAYDAGRVSLTLTSNGTMFSDPIATFLRAHQFKFCVSCDGPPQVQDTFRQTAAGLGSAVRVERTLTTAQSALPAVLVNAVYHPRTFRHLPEVVDYLAGLGLRQIYLNPDFSACWTKAEADELAGIYRAVAERYIAWYLDHDPHFISLIDSKIAVLLRGGYHPLERCQMGKGEMAFTPDGGIYPCERLIGDGTNDKYRIGHVDHGLDLSRLVCRQAPNAPLNLECRDCGLKDCCMNWCGCSNAFMTGYYNRVGPLLCASERAAIQVALEVFTTLERRLGPVFLHHLSGTPQLNSKLEEKGGADDQRPRAALGQIKAGVTQ